MSIQLKTSCKGARVQQCAALGATRPAQDICPRQPLAPGRSLAKRSHDRALASAAAASPQNKPQNASSAQDDAAGTSTSGQHTPYSYHSDGHYKATIEDIFGEGRGTVPLGSGTAPWQMGWQANERNIVWNDDLKMRLLTVRLNATLCDLARLTLCRAYEQAACRKKVAAQQGSVSEEQLRAQLSDLLALLPALQPRLPSMKPDILLRLASDTTAVAQKLLQLKAIFPEADCGRMLVKELGLMSEDDASLRRRAAELRAFLPTMCIDVVVETHPSVLSVESFKAAVQDARRLMPGASIEGLLLTDPDFVLSLQKGTDMIPYDAIPENPWGHQ